jgi:hypothetical protein
MAYETSTQWTSWHTPNTISQTSVGNNNAFINLDNAKTYSAAADVSGGKVRSDVRSPYITCSNFAFDEIPENATINRIWIMIMARDYTGRGIKERLLRLRTPASASNVEGWVPACNDAAMVWAAGNATEHNYNRQAQGAGKACDAGYWGGGNVSASDVRSSDFGFVYQLVGTSSNYSEPRILGFKVAISYTFQTLIVPDPTYIGSISLSTTSLSDNGSNSSKLNVSLRNTNSVTGVAQASTITLTGGIKFTDGSTSKTIPNSVISANGTLSNDFYIVGTSAGTGTVTVTNSSASNWTNGTTSATINVTASYVAPTYVNQPSVPEWMYKNALGYPRINLYYMNTNNVAGNISSTNISVSGAIRFTDESTTKTVSGASVSAGGVYQNDSAQIKAVSTGIGYITITNNETGTHTLKITVKDPVSYFDVELSLDKSEVAVGNTTTLTYKLINKAGESVIPGTLNFSIGEVTTAKFTSNNSANLNVTINSYVDDSYTGTVSITGVTVGQTNVTVTNENIGTQSKTINVSNSESTFDWSVTANPASIPLDNSTTSSIQVKFINTNNTAGYTPEVNISLPSGLTTLDGKSSYTMAQTSVIAASTKTLTLQVIGTSTGNKNVTVTTLGVSKKCLINVTEKVISTDPIWESNWITLSKTSLYVDGVSTAQIMILFEATNNVAGTVGKTTITLPSNLKFTDGSTYKEISAQTLLAGEKYDNTLKDQLYITAASVGEGYIQVTNDTLGNITLPAVNVPFKTTKVPARFIMTASLLPKTVEHTTNGTATFIEIKYTNVGGEAGISGETKINLIGNIHAENLETVITIPDIILGEGETHTEKFRIIETGCESDVYPCTAKVIVSNSTINFNYQELLTIIKPVTPTYNTNIIANPSQINLPGETSTNSTTPVKVVQKNTNSIAGSTPELKVYVLENSGIKFNDNSTTQIVAAQTVALDGTSEVTLDQVVKAVNTGTYRLYVTANVNPNYNIVDCTVLPETGVANTIYFLKKDMNEVIDNFIEYIYNATTGEFELTDKIITTCTVDVYNPILSDFGHITILNSFFESNHGNNGASICNRGSITWENNQYTNNIAEGKCPKLDNNGECKE